MATTIGDLAVRVGADTDGLTKGLKKSANQLKQFGGKVRSGATDFTKYAAAASAAGAALAVGLGVKAANTAKELSNLSTVAGASLDEFQKLAFGARKFGIEQDKLSDILKDVNDRVGDFVTTGGGPMADFFEQIGPKIGITAEAFKDLSGPQALQLYVESLEKANVNQQEMTFFMEAMASDATALLPLLQDGGKALAEQAREVEALGTAVSDLDVENLRLMSEGFTKASGVVDSLTTQLSAEFAPLITEVNKEFADMVKEMGGADDIAETSFNNIIDGLGFVADAADGVGRVFKIAGLVIETAFDAMTGASLLFVDALVNGPIKAINQMIETVNEFTGAEFDTVGFTAAGMRIQEAFDITTQSIKDNLAEIDAILLEPMPSDRFEQFVLQTQEAAAAAKAAADESRAAEVEAVAEHYDIIDTLFAEHESHMRAAERQAAAESVAIAEAQAAAKKAALGDSLKQLSTLLNSESKKMFNIGKAAAIADTTISTFSSAQKSYDALAPIPIVGPALGAAAAAAALTAGFARVQAIRSTNRGGSGGGGAAASNTAAVNASSTPTGGGVISGGGGDSNIFVQGIDPDALFRGQDLIGLINEAQERGGRLVIQQ